jgi:hypothetical protein
MEFGLVTMGIVSYGSKKTTRTASMNVLGLITGVMVSYIPEVTTRTIREKVLAFRLVRLCR